MEYFQKFAAKNWLARCTDLTAKEKLIWMVLNEYQGSKAHCWVSQDRLAFDLGYADKTSVEKGIKRLADKMYLCRKRVGTHRGRKNRNYYAVTTPTEWDATNKVFLDSLINPATTAGSVPRQSSGGVPRQSGGVYSSYGSSYVKDATGAAPPSSSKSSTSRSKSKSTPIDPICVIPGHSHGDWCQFVRVDENDDCVVCGAFQGLSTCYPDNHEGGKPEVSVYAVGNWDDPEV